MYRRLSDLGIWGFAFGYFACYAPYSALTKALSKGLLPGMESAIPGFALLPSTTIASLVGMIAFLAILLGTGGRFRAAAGARAFPHPGTWTFLSGLCTAMIIGTTTLAYTFKESIVFMMLMMRGGVLIIAPLVDALSRRKVKWYSWVALALTVIGLIPPVAVKMIQEHEKTGSLGLVISLGALLDVVLYLGSYFVRLRFMSRLAKSEDPNARLRYFVEEQMVATPAIVFALAMVALFSPSLGAGAEEVRAGFTGFTTWGWAIGGTAILVGLLSQGTGIFGGLILLDKRENTFCVPVNRASSVLAGVLASVILLGAGQKIDPWELLGASFVIAAIVVLSVPPLLAKRTPAPAIAPGS